MKKMLPLLVAGVVFLIALALMRPEPRVGVVVAGRDLPAGHRLTKADLSLRQFPRSLAPEGGYAEPELLVGQTLRVARTKGDVLYAANLGGENIVLAPDERAIAVEVTDAAGLAGLLKAGDHVGVTAVIFGGSQGAFAKTVAGGLRVLYISPEFKAADPFDVNPPASTEEGPLGAVPPSRSRRATRGTVVLAVPTKARVIAYDFTPFGVESERRVVYVTELLPALDHANNVELSLFLEPGKPSRFSTSGLYLPELVITPGPTPTPTQKP